MFAVFAGSTLSPESFSSLFKIWIFQMIAQECSSEKREHMHWHVAVKPPNSGLCRRELVTKDRADRTVVSDKRNSPV